MFKKEKKGMALAENRRDHSEIEAMRTEDGVFDFANFLQKCKQKHFSAKDIIYRQGDRVDNVYLIQSGLVKQLCYLPNGRARIVRLHAKDHWIGLEGLGGRVYEHTTVAVDAVDAQYFPIHMLQRLEKINPRRLYKLLDQSFDDLACADRWILDFCTGDIKSRVANLLEYLAKLRCEGSTDQFTLLAVHEMAEILGVTQESVSRILAAFKRSDILQKRPDMSEKVYRLNSGRLLQESRARESVEI